MSLRSVLLIDDNPDDNFIHATWLKRAGAVASSSDIIVKENGLEAITFMEAWDTNRAALGDAFPPALILVDINMPVMNGFAFLERLEKLSGHRSLDSVVILMLTSSLSPQDQQQAGESPLVRGYIAKPLNRAKIEAILAEHFPG